MINSVLVPGSVTIQLFWTLFGVLSLCPISLFPVLVRHPSQTQFDSLNTKSTWLVLGFPVPLSAVSVNLALYLSMISKEFYGKTNENMMIINHVSIMESQEMSHVEAFQQEPKSKVTSKALLRSGQRSQAQEVSQRALEELEKLKGQGSPELGGVFICIHGWDEGQGMDGIDSDVDESTGTSYIFFCASGRMLLVGFMGWASLEYALRNWAAVLQLPAPGFFMIRRRTYDLTIKWRRSLMYGLICALAKNEIQNPWMPLRRSFNL